VSGVCPWGSPGVCLVGCALNRIDEGEIETPQGNPKGTQPHPPLTPRNPEEPQGNPRGSTMPPPCVCVWEPRGSRGTLWGRLGDIPSQIIVSKT